MNRSVLSIQVPKEVEIKVSKKLLERLKTCRSTKVPREWDEERDLIVLSLYETTNKDDLAKTLEVSKASLYRRYMYLKNTT